MIVRPREHVRRPGPLRGVVGLIAADAGGRAVFPICAHGQAVAVPRHCQADPEVIAHSGVGGLDVRLLGPGLVRPREHIDGPGIRGRVVGLVAAHAGGRAGLAKVPTARVSPSADKPTLIPNPSPAPVLEALRYPCCDQALFARANT